MPPKSSPKAIKAKAVKMAKLKKLPQSSPQTPKAKTVKSVKSKKKPKVTETFQYQEITEEAKLSVISSNRRRPATRSFTSPKAPKTRKRTSKEQLTSPKPKKPKLSVVNTEIPIHRLKTWESLSEKITNTTETETKNWRTAIQIRLAILTIIYDKITTEKKSVDEVVRELKLKFRKLGSEELLENLNSEFHKITKKPGKNLLVSFVIVVTENGHKIIDISDPNQILHLIDPEKKSTSEMFGTIGEDINPQRDFHTEAAACAELPNIIKESLINLGYKFYKNTLKNKGPNKIKKIYIYFDSLKSGCNPCIEKIRYIQEDNPSLPLSIILNWRQEHQGEMSKTACNSSSDSGSPKTVDIDSESEKPKPDFTPIKSSHNNNLERATPLIERCKEAKENPDELLSLIFKSRAYISGSLQTRSNEKFFAAINQNKSEINNLVFDCIKNIFRLKPAQRNQGVAL